MRSVSLSSRILTGRRKRQARGNALIEVSLLAPWLLFLFVGVFDMGFYTYSLISVENAARVAAEYTSGYQTVANDQSGACTRVRAELSTLANFNTLPTTCNALPLIVSASYLPTGGPDGKPVTSVTVTYRTNQLVPIPGLMPGQLTIARNVVMRVKP